MIDLTKYEELLLISILHLKENAYGVFIRRKIKKTTGKQWNYGTLYRMLDQLVRKGLLERKEGESMPEKGGRRKKYYKITKFGVENPMGPISIHFDTDKVRGPDFPEALVQGKVLI